MACLPITDSASVGAPYYASGGGGGGGSTSSITGGGGSAVSISTTGAIYMTMSGSATTPDIVIGDNNTLSVALTNGNDLINLFNNAIAFSTLKVDMSETNLQVSSINGAAPGGGGFVSTFFAVPLPAATSTVLMELPAGTWSYNGLALASGSYAYLNGFANVASDSVPNYYGSIFPPLPDNTQGAGIFPAAMTLNIGDSPLSTIQLIVANNSGGTAAAFTGGVFKLN
jgi:hypothetical protein